MSLSCAMNATKGAPPIVDSKDRKRTSRAKRKMRKQIEAKAQAKAQVIDATPRIVTPQTNLNCQRMARRPQNAGRVHVPNACRD